jgi:hypothetical protein
MAAALRLRPVVVSQPQRLSQTRAPFLAPSATPLAPQPQREIAIVAPHHGMPLPNRHVGGGGSGRRLLGAALADDIEPAAAVCRWQG